MFRERDSKGGAAQVAVKAALAEGKYQKTHGEVRQEKGKDAFR